MPNYDMSYMTIPIFLFKISGFHKTSNLTWRKFVVYVGIPLQFVVEALIILELKNPKNDIGRVVDIFESACTITQLPMRKLSIMFRGDILQEIMSDCEKFFWPHDLFGKKKLETELAKIMKIAETIFHLLLVGGTVLLSSFFVVSMIYGDGKDLPEICYIPNLPFAKEVLYILQVLFCMETFIHAGIFDGSFLLIVTDLIVQFRMLGEAFNVMKFTSNDSKKEKVICLNMLKVAARQHQRLIMIHKKLSKFYSEYFVAQYFACIASVVIQLYVTSVTDLAIGVLVRHMIYLIVISFQLAFFFIPASFLSEQAEKFELEIYNSNWYLSDDIEIRKHVRFMLMRSQKPVVLTGANFFPINRSQFLAAFRVAYSITTLLQNVK